MKIQAHRKGFTPITFDYFVGGYPEAQKVEMGSYAFYAENQDQTKHNLTGRIYEAFNNKTFSGDYSLTVYQGYGEINKTSVVPYEKVDYVGTGEYYTGFFELYDLQPGVFVAIAETPSGFTKNFQRFYTLPTPFPRIMRSLPMVPDLEEGELALVLQWGYSPRDLDIHVEFVASPTIECKVDFANH